jgi:NADH-quinone oxidoreductase subunit G
MPKMTINGAEVEFESGLTILQVAESLGIEVPVFCYHPKLNIAGNCRMCLVEVEKSPKPVASCAMPAADGMVVRTNSPYVEKARKGVLEFLLINHPLDCPICDQGGECDLQDLTLYYGPGLGKYKENKRSVSEKYFGPLIKTWMTRCIHCTRCVRFASEIAGTPELGGVGRGEHTEIVTSTIESAIASELSGNMIDICPVGALTSKPYAFRGRSWELTKTDSIDVFDGVGANIRVDSIGAEVMRILPRHNEAVNEEWLADKSRFACDGLKSQRLDRPYVRNAKGKLVEATWDEAFKAIAQRLQDAKKDRVGALLGGMVDLESAYAMKQLMLGLGVQNFDCRHDLSDYDVSMPGHYRFNTTIAGIEQADVCLLIGTQPRFEAPLINARLRKRYVSSGLKAALIGAFFESTFPLEHLGDDSEVLNQILSGKHPFAKALMQAQNPMLILGEGALSSTQGAQIHAVARALAGKYKMVRDDWNGFNVLHTSASRVGCLDIGFVPGKEGMPARQIVQKAQKGAMDVLYLLNVDDIPVGALEKPFVIYQGHHGDQSALHADVILPGAAYTEKEATYVNVEGRVQHAFKAVFPPGEAKEDWKIVRALSDHVRGGLEFVDLDQLRQSMAHEFPALTNINVPSPCAIDVPTATDLTQVQGRLQATIVNYYMTDPISRHSQTMARCTQEIIEGKWPKPVLAGG